MVTYPNLYYLKYFADAVELGSMSAAAQKNLVTHPAVSRAIANLEDYLGTKLLEHQKKNFKPTAAGYQVAEQARVLLAAAKDFKNLGIETESENPTVISIGISRTLSKIYLTSLLGDLKLKFPNVRMQVRFGTTLEVTEAVAQNSLDLGITIGSQNLPSLQQKVIRTGQFILVESSASKKSAWEKKSFILTEPRFETELLKKEYYREFKETLPISMEVSSWDVISELVQQGLGVGLLPDISLRGWKKGSYSVLRPSWFNCDYEIYIHHSKAALKNRAVAYATEMLLSCS